MFRLLCHSRSLVAVSGVLFSSSTFSQTSETHATLEDAAMEHVIVSVPGAKKLADTALPITVLSGEALREAAAASIGETLSSSPGLARSSFGPAVGQVVIRGQQGPRVSVLQNSVSSADAASVSADHANNVEAVLADSIEVLRGPATLLYGGGAIGGVVNVIDGRIPSKAIDGLEGVVEVRHNSANNGNDGVFRLDGGSESWAWHMDGIDRNWDDLDIPGWAYVEEPSEGSRGFIENSDGSSRVGSLGLSKLFETGFVGISVNRSDMEYGLPLGSHAHHDEHDEHDDHDDHDEDEHDEHEGEEHGVRLELQQTRYDIKSEIEFPQSRYLDTLKIDLGHSTYRHQELEGDEGEVGTEFNNRVNQSRVQLSHREILDWTGVVGLQTVSRSYSAIGEESFIPRSHISGLGVFLLESIDLSDWTFELGARFDRDKIKAEGIASEASFSNSSFAFSGLRDLQEGVSLGFSLSESSRAPTTEELFSNYGLESEEWVTHGATGVIEVGDSSLNSETSSNFDVSVNVSHGQAHGFISAFYNRFDDYIYLADADLLIDEVEVFEYRQEKAEFSGFEYEWHWSKASTASNLQWDVTLGGDWVRGRLENGDVPRMPASKHALSLRVSRDEAQAWLRITHALEQDRVSEHENPSDAYTRVDLGADWHWTQNSRETLLFLKVKNLSNETIRNSASFVKDYAPESGRALEVGVRVTF